MIQAGDTVRCVDNKTYITGDKLPLERWKSYIVLEFQEKSKELFGEDGVKIIDETEEEGLYLASRFEKVEEE